MMSTAEMSRLEQPLDRSVAGTISISRHGMAIESMSQAMEFAKLMAKMKEALPKHCRENAGICLALAIQSYEWGMNPLSVANKSYVVNDRLCYEAALYHSVVCRRAPIVGRVKMDYIGDGLKRRCRVFADLSDGTGTVDYTSPAIDTIKPQNSPLWKSDPDQQLFYYSVRAFARRHFPDVMMGIYTVDEMQDSSEALTAVMESRPKTERLAERLLATTPATRVVEAMDVVQPEPEKQQDTEPSPATGILKAISRAMSDIELREYQTAADSSDLTDDERYQIEASIAGKRKELSK